MSACAAALSQQVLKTPAAFRSGLARLTWTPPRHQPWILRAISKVMLDPSNRGRLALSDLVIFVHAGGATARICHRFDVRRALAPGRNRGRLQVRAPEGSLWRFDSCTGDLDALDLAELRGVPAVLQAQQG